MFSIEMAFGHSRKDGSLVPFEQIQEAKCLALVRFAELFSGGRALACDGSYLTKDAKIILENATIITTYTRDIPTSVWVQLLLLSGRIAAMLDQENVLLEWHLVFGAIVFVEPLQQFFKKSLKLMAF